MSFCFSLKAFVKINLKKLQSVWLIFNSYSLAKKDLIRIRVMCKMKGWVLLILLKGFVKHFVQCLFNKLLYNFYHLIEVYTVKVLNISKPF